MSSVPSPAPRIPTSSWERTGAHREIDNICQIIRNCARAGIPSAKYALTLLGVLRTEATVVAAGPCTPHSSTPGRGRIRR